jgi:hypothetical protein
MNTDTDTDTDTKLKPGDPVRVWDHEKRNWRKGAIVIRLHDPRSYIIRISENRTQRRNRRDLKIDRSIRRKPESDEGVKKTMNYNGNHSTKPAIANRSGRIINRPA